MRQVDLPSGGGIPIVRILWEIENLFTFTTWGLSDTPGMALLLVLAPLLAIGLALLLGRVWGSRQEGEAEDESPATSSVTVTVVVTFCLIMAVVIPSCIRGRNISQQNACISNLRQIDSGKEQWAMAGQIPDGCPANTASINEYIKANTTPRCPSGGTYIYNAIGTDPDCTRDDVTSHSFAG